MKRRVLLAAVLGVTAWFTPQSAEAFGGKLFGGRGKGCAAPVMAGGCGAAPVAADFGGCGGSAPATVGGCGGTVAAADAGSGGVSYTTQTVTRYVPRTVVTPTKVTTYKQEWVAEPYTYTVSRAVTAVTPQTQTYTVCVPTQVTENVSVSRRVMVATPMNPCGPAVSGVGGGCGAPVMAGCGGCGSPAVVSGCAAPAMTYTCQTVTECHPVTRTVMQMQTQTRVVNVATVSYVNEQMTGTRQVCKVSPVESTVNVTTYTQAMVAKQGTRQVCKVLPVESTVNVTSTVMDAVTETVQVPVAAAAFGTSACGPVAAPSNYASAVTADCDPCGKPAKKGFLGGLFGRFRK